MIVLALALQIAIATPAPGFITVRDGTTSSQVPVTMTGGDALVRADALMNAMRGTLITGTNLHYTLALPKARIALIDGIPFAKLDTVTIPLGRAPQVRGGQLYLPFQFVSEVIPRYGGGYSYDANQGELRSTSTPVIATRPAAVPNTPAPVAARPAPVSKPAQRKLIVIDAGHGGPDNGMTGPIGTTPWFVEKDVTLSVAKKLATVMRA